MKLLHHPPLFAGLLLVLAAAGGAAGFVTGPSATPDATRSEGIVLCGSSAADSDMVRLLPASGFVSSSYQTYRDSTGSGGVRYAATCEAFTRTARVTVSAHPVGTLGALEWERQFAGVNRLSPQQAVHVSAGDGALAWPSSAVVHVTCLGLESQQYGAEVRLGGDAGRDVPSRQTAVGGLAVRSAGLVKGFTGCDSRQ